MSTKITVSVTGKDFPKVRAIGCEIQLGINQIPVAFVGIDPCGCDLLKDMDKYRRKECVIVVEAGRQKLKFNCLFDGMSYTMAPGGMSYTAVFKGKFQYWLEIFPFAPGIHPMGINPFKQQDWVSKASDSEKALTSDIITSSIGTDLTNANLAEAIVKIYSNLIKVIIEKSKTPLVNKDAQVNPLMLENVISQMAAGENNPNYKKSLQAAAELISQIDTSALKDFKVNTASFNTVKFLLNGFIDATSQQQDLWGALVQSLGSIGAVIIPSFNKLFIIPECYFLKGADRKVPKQKEFIDKPNFASPGYYNSISLSDNGYKDVSAVAVVVRRTIPELGITKQTGGYPETFIGAESATNFYGSYPDLSKTIPPTVHGGLLVLPADLITSLYAAYPPVHNAPAQAAMARGVGVFGAVASESEVMKTHVDANKVLAPTTTASGIPITDILNNLAESKYMGVKYGDRSGSINMLFNTAWVPGTSGTAYTRYPDPDGMFVDFYVTQVRHVFDPGSAVTQVSFAGARVGHNPQGLDSLLIYKYDTTKMLEVQKKYIEDIGS